MITFRNNLNPNLNSSDSINELEIGSNKQKQRYWGKKRNVYKNKKNKKKQRAKRV